MNKKNCAAIRALRVRMWLETGLSASGMKNPRQLEAHLYPDANKTDPNNTWYRYGRGENIPRPQQVKRLEEKYPGTSKVLNHGLWELLEQEYTDVFEIARIVENLDHAYVKDLLKARIYLRYSQKKLEKAFKFELSMLHRLLRADSLDALTGLVLYWKVAHQSGNISNIHMVAKVIYRYLLMISINICPANLQKLFFVVFKKHIFNRSKTDLGYCQTNSKMFMESRKILQYAAYLGGAIDEHWAMYELLKSKNYNFGLGLDIVFDFSHGSVLPIYINEEAYLNHCEERIKKFNYLYKKYVLGAPQEFEYGCDYYYQKQHNREVIGNDSQYYDYESLWLSSIQN